MINDEQKRAYDAWRMGGSLNEEDEDGLEDGTISDERRAEIEHAKVMIGIQYE